MELNSTLVKIAQLILRNLKSRVSANITQAAIRSELKITVNVD